VVRWGPVVVRRGLVVVRCWSVVGRVGSGGVRWWSDGGPMVVQWWSGSALVVVRLGPVVVRWDPVGSGGGPVVVRWGPVFVR
jgi:hypothetical protein